MAKKRRVEDEEDTDPEMDSSEEEEVEENEEESAEEEEDSEKSLEEPEPESASSEEDLSELLEPLPKEKLIDIIRLASVENKKLISEIHKIADSDPSHRKLFVHGLGWETNSDKLREIFSVYGELEDCNIVVDKNTGKSKGYGFILFKHRKSASKALKEPQKKIENRMTACQLASSGPVNIPSQQQHQGHQHQHQPQQFQQMNKKNGGNSGVASQQTQEMLQRKIYVANVHPEINGEKLHSFFSKFGEIEEGPLGFDKNTGKPKGFALFIYKTLEGAKKALEEPSKNFDGHVLHVQKATDNNKQKTGGSGSAPLPAGVMPAKNDGYNHVGNAGFNPQPGGPGFNPQNGVMGHPGLMMNHGLMGGVPQPYGQGMQPVQAALAVLAAAGQNPAAFGMMNPALAGFNPAMVPPFGMGNSMYPNPQGPYQVGPSGQGPAKRPALGPTGGYSAR